ncbi:MAG: metal-dependent hydrolase [Candidatus Poribacteria bacterium]|nr:metal-dependent hydrolase [Candidatus Poribacteria bacterium]
MSSRIRFFGVAAYEIVTSRGQHILIDPFLDENPGSPIRSEELERVDLIIVSHAAFDHLGDTEALAKRTDAPVICGGEVKAYLTAKGVSEHQIRATTWGIRVEVAGIEVQPVECHHWSQIRMPDGSFASGVPMSFVVYADDDLRFYHYGDTALFSDMRLIAELYQPNVGCIGVSNPYEILTRVSGPGRLVTGEMGTREAAMAAKWLGLETVLPCHYIDPDNDDVRAFLEHYGDAGKVVVQKPGDVLEIG